MPQAVGDSGGGALGVKQGIYLLNVQSYCHCPKDGKLRRWMKWFKSGFVATLQPNDGGRGLSN